MNDYARTHAVYYTAVYYMYKQLSKVSPMPAVRVS